MPESLANTHPSWELLRLFGSGKLSGLEEDAIQGHVASCPVCSQLLRDLAGQSHKESTCSDFHGTASPSDDVAGKLPECVGRYRVENEIARGGMGQVVRVTDEVFQRPLAMKIALFSGDGKGKADQDTRERFVRGALLTGQLQHPGIPPVQEMGQLDDGRPYFIMKLVKGSDLGDLLCNRPSALDDLPRWVAIFEQICQTLGYAHSHKIIHRDLKPANIMVGAFGEVQVMDWGLAKLLTPGSLSLRETQAQPGTFFSVSTPSALPLETMPGMVMGTSAYMPPEQARGEAETLDPRCDVFGLGGILCEILTGKPPFAEKTSIDNQRLSMKGDLSDAFARLGACGADAELVSLARQCLAPDRKDRPADAGGVAKAVGRYQAALQERMKQAEIDKAAALVQVREEQKRRVVEEARADEERKRHEAERKRRRLSLALAAALVLLVVGGSASALWYQGEMARQDAEMIRQDADKLKRDEKLALRRESLNNNVFAALADAEQRRQELLSKLADQPRLNDFLSDIDQWQRALNAALLAWGHAKALADGSPELVEQALAERLLRVKDDVRAAEKDFKVGKACDDARLAAATIVEGKWDPQLAAKKYPGIFAGAGLDVERGDPHRIAAQITSSPIRLVYLAALDHWATVTDKNKYPELLARLHAIANVVDTDPWRKDFRNALLVDDKKQLQALAGKVDFKEQSPQILVALANQLPNSADGILLLRRSLTYHPKDFWIFYDLGRLSAKSVESEGYHRAALALRPSSSPAHNNLAGVLYDRKDLEGAIKHLRMALDANPDLVQANVGLGTILFREKNDVDGAIKHLRRALDFNPDDAAAHSNLGNVLRANRDLEGAIEHCRKALKIDSNFAEAHVNLGNALFLKADVAEAIKHYRMAIEIKPTLAQAHGGLGNALLEQKDADGAIKHFRAALAIDPNLAGFFHNSFGLALREKKDLDGAIEQFRLAVKIDSRDAMAHNNLGNALHARKDVEGAIKHYRMALAIDPNHAMAHNNLGTGLRDKEDMEGAIKQYRIALEINPRLALAHNNLGSAFYARKDVEGAIKHFRMAIDIKPNYELAYNNLGTALLDKKDVEGAIINHLKALDINPNNPGTHFDLGIAHYAKKDLEGAVMHYRKALAIDPNHAAAHNNLGSALLAKKDIDGAIKHHLKAIELNPGNAIAHFNLGNALNEKKDFEGAIRHFRKAIDINPNHFGAHSNLGNILVNEKKDVEGGIAHYLKAIAINPKSAELHDNLGIALGMKKNYEASIRQFRKALEINPNFVSARVNLAVVHGNLGNALLVQGRFAEARAATLECLRWLPTGNPQRKKVQQQLQRCEQLLAFDNQLSAILKGEEPPNDAVKLAILARLCHRYKQYHVAATRFYAGALEKDARLAIDLRKNMRHEAACAASLAGTGKGKDADKLQDQDRSKLRQQALDWLRADLTLYRKLSQSGKVEEVLLVTQKLAQWQRDPALAGVRDARALAELPQQEREPWQQLWADLAQILKETRSRFTLTQHQGLTARQTEQIHEVKLHAGKTYVFDLESPQFDAFLRLQNAAGKVLDENDDISPEDQNSRLVFSPSEPGVYRIVVTSFQQRGTGAYTLTIRELAGPLATKNGPKSLEP